VVGDGRTWGGCFNSCPDLVSFQLFLISWQACQLLPLFLVSEQKPSMFLKHCLLLPGTLGWGLSEGHMGAASFSWLPYRKKLSEPAVVRLLGQRDKEVSTNSQVNSLPQLQAVLTSDPLPLPWQGLSSLNPAFRLCHEL
jgi:hypothetical protein